MTGSVLTGEAAIPGRRKTGAKTRPLTAEEIAAAEAAERSVSAALANQKALPPGTAAEDAETAGSPYLRKIAKMAEESTPETDMMDKILDKAKALAARPQAAAAPVAPAPKPAPPAPKPAPHLAEQE